MAAMVATNVAIMQGTKISVALADFKDALAAIIVTGIRVKPAACKHKNMTCALVAVSFSGFNSCKLCMVLIPNGVAALSKFSKLAEKFIIINPMDGCPLGISGKIRVKNGPIMRDKTFIPPAFSAMVKKPINKAITPIKLIQISTAVLQVAMMPSEACSL